MSELPPPPEPTHDPPTEAEKDALLRWELDANRRIYEDERKALQCLSAAQAHPSHAIVALDPELAAHERKAEAFMKKARSLTAARVVSLGLELGYPPDEIDEWLD
jgi:hypothetical protein